MSAADAAEGDLTAKVDRLLEKHRAGSVDSAVTAEDIPVLTEFLDGPEWQQPVPPQDILAKLDETAIDRLAQEVFARVYQRFESEMANKLEDRLTAQLLPQISAAVSHTVGDMRTDIANDIGDAVNAALGDLLRKS